MTTPVLYARDKKTGIFSIMLDLPDGSFFQQEMNSYNSNRMHKLLEAGLLLFQWESEDATYYEGKERTKIVAK
jgi:hypothetical protein